MPQPSDFLLAVPAMTAAAAASGSDRKSLVIVYLGGAPDTHNTIIPRTGSNRTFYDAARPTVGIADNPATLLDASWCLHPSLTGMKTLWDADKLAIIRNVGTLVQPTTRAQYLANSVPLPGQLFSHSDQTVLWGTGIADQPTSQTGWAGRLAELLIPFNTAPDVAPLLSWSGTQGIQRGFDLRTLSLGTSGLVTRDGNFRVSAGAQTILNTMLASETFTDLLMQEYVDAHARSVDATATIQAAIAATADPTAIPNTDALGQRMRTLIRLANSQSTMGHRRSVFFLTHGGYDDHATLLSGLAGRYDVLDDVLKGAYDATVTLGIQNNVTFLVFGEFGRSLSQNGTGTDHGWGGNAFVFGGAVNGGWYGDSYTLDTAGPNIVDVRGHLVPTTPVETLVASVAKWMGVPDALSNGVNPLDLLNPNLPDFPVRDLAFL